jgi:dimethylargininase
MNRMNRMDGENTVRESASRRAVWEFRYAIARTPGASAVQGLRADGGEAPSIEALGLEHAEYVAALRGAGVEVQVLPALEAFPDSLFVEDTALVFDDGAILLRPGAPSRFGETAEIAPVLRERFDVCIEMPGPGFADGGDVLVTPATVYIGRSDRTDARGAQSLAACLDRLGRSARVVTPPAGLLHLKTGCSLLDEETVVATASLAASGVLGGLRCIEVAEGEDAAANSLRVNDVVLVDARCVRTQERLDRAGYRVVPVPVEEAGKLDAGLSCMSLRW